MQAVKITPKAIEKIKYIRTHKNIPQDYALRLLIEGGSGCGSAVRYRLGFDTKKESDEQYVIEGVEVIYDKKHLLYLVGMEIDFEELQDEQGFVFSKMKKT